jgi:hypothetical protein
MLWVDSGMTAHLWLVSLLIIPGLFGLTLLMNWLEVFFTYQLVADEVAVAWQSIESVDDLERKVGLIVARVMSDADRR